MKNQASSIASLNPAELYPSLITPGLLSLVRRECHWKPDFPILIPGANQRITSYHAGFSFVYTYPFTLGFNPPIDPVIIEFCRYFNICFGQIGPIVWR